MQNQQIFVSEYSRTDGRVRAIRMGDKWALRSIFGPAWFWNRETETWDISSAPGFRADAPRYLLTLPQVLKLLPIISPVSVTESNTERAS